MIDIYDFLKSGRHPKYTLGMKEFELPATDVWQKNEMDDYATIFLTYDGHQLTFYEGKLITISVETLNGDVRVIKGEVLESRDSFILAIGLFAKHDISWQFVDKYCFDKQLCLRTEGGVDLLFGFSGNSQTLEKIVQSTPI